MAKSTVRKKGVKFNKNHTPMSDPTKLYIRRIVQSTPRPGLTRNQKAYGDMKETEHELSVLRRQKVARNYDKPIRELTTKYRKGIYSC